MTIRTETTYTRANFPTFVCAHGNWDIWANARGYCAAIPSVSGEAAGCRGSGFGDMDYVRATLPTELAAAALSAASA